MCELWQINCFSTQKKMCSRLQTNVIGWTRENTSQRIKKALRIQKKKPISSNGKRESDDILSRTFGWFTLLPLRFNARAVCLNFSVMTGAFNAETSTKLFNFFNISFHSFTLKQLIIEQRSFVLLFSNCFNTYPAFFI